MEEDCHPKPAGKILDTVTSAVTLNRSSIDDELTSDDGTAEDLRRILSWTIRRLASAVLLEARDRVTGESNMGRWKLDAER